MDVNVASAGDSADDTTTDVSLEGKGDGAKEEDCVALTWATACVSLLSSEAILTVSATTSEEGVTPFSSSLFGGGPSSNSGS